MDWPTLLRWFAITLAVAGGVASTVAFTLSRRVGRTDADAHKSHLVYLISYILMSLSIFFLALQGLVGDSS